MYISAAEQLFPSRGETQSPEKWEGHIQGSVYPTPRDPKESPSHGSQIWEGAWGGHLLQALFPSSHETVSILQKGELRPRGSKGLEVTQPVHGSGQNPASRDSSSLRGSVYQTGLLWGFRLPEPPQTAIGDSSGEGGA